MEPIRQIVAIANLTGSKQTAIERAADLAGQLNAHLHIHGVVYHPEFAMDLFHMGGLANLAENTVEDTEIKLQEIVKRLPIDASSVSTKVTWGHPFDRVVMQTTIQDDTDLVVFSPRGAGRLSSAEWRLIHRCQVPLLIAHTQLPYTQPVIAACVDPGQDDLSTDTEKCILEVASGLATQLKGSLEICHALGSIPSIIGVAESPQQYETELRDVRRRQILELMPAQAAEKTPMHMPARPFEDAIPEICNNRSVSLIVMSVIARSSIAELLIGSAARKVLPKLDRDVLVIRPK